MFDDHFEAVLADTAEARRINFRIRFQVYCLETGFEDAIGFPDRLERDEWDESAAHFLVRSRASGEWVGAMRLILPSSRMLPIERFCEIDERVAMQLPRAELGEVSRLCMVAHYRRRVQEITYPYEFPVQSAGYGQGLVARERRREPEILFGLLRAALQYSREHQVRYWYILGTPALSRLISRYNVRMQAVGPLCEHRGGRYPYWANLDVEARRASRGSKRLSLFLRRAASYRRFSELEEAADGVGDKMLLESAPF